VKTLIVGSAGFIGSHIYEKYKAAGHEVIRIDRKHEHHSPKDGLYSLDLGLVTYSNLLQILKGVEVVNHLAAQIDVRESIRSPSQDAHQNIMLSLKLLEASIEAGVKRFIFSSSGGAIDNSEFPTSPYGIAKLTIEKYLNFYQKQHNLETVVLRYSNVYGPRQRDGVISLFIPKLLKNQPITINGDGSQTRDFVFVKDVAEANNIALTCQSGIYTISSGSSISIKETTEQLIKLCSSTSEVTYGISQKGEILESNLQSSGPKGWEATTSLEDGLKQTIEYYKQNRS